MNYRVVIAVAGGTNMRGHILTEDACRDAASQDPFLYFDEMTGNLIADIQLNGDKGITSVPYPAAWLKDADEVIKEDPRKVSTRMKEALGHLTGS